MRLLLLVLCAILPVRAMAQRDTVLASSAALRLHVQQADSLAVPLAEVTVKDARSTRTTRTDSGGNARFEGLGPGALELRVRRIGFSESRLHARIAAGENALTVQLDGAAATLGEVRIVGNRRVVPRLDDFETRLLRKDANAVVTQDQIQRRNPIALSQMLRGIAGIRIADSMGAIVAVSTRGKVMNKKALVDCVLRVAVDGVIQPALTDIDAVRPAEVYGVEVFFGPARIPPQFGGLRTDSWCGLISIWIRSG